MNTMNTTRPVTMPPGEYFLGDPCYAVPDGLWQEWLDNAYANPVDPSLTILYATVKDHPVIGLSTGQGDGVFYDEETDSAGYGVDSGMIGLTPMALYRTAPEDHPKGSMSLEALGQIVTFKDDVICCLEDDAIRIGERRIYTGRYDFPEKNSPENRNEADPTPNPPNPTPFV